MKFIARIFSPRRRGPEDDAALLRRVQRGQRDALTRFYEAHVDALHAFIFYRVARDPALAEDVVQETFTLALNTLDQYDPARGGVETWLRNLSRNVIRRHLREHSASAALAERWERLDATLNRVFDALEPSPQSDELLMAEETREQVREALTLLPPRYRDALERKYVQGETLEEVAARLGLGVAATKSLLARARRAFRATYVTLFQCSVIDADDGTLPLVDAEDAAAPRGAARRSDDQPR